MPEQPAAGPRRQRADAERNRDHLLRAARTVVAEQGTTASLRDIARRAEVSLPTLYRHFPTRDTLLKTLFEEGLRRLTDRAGELAGGLAPDEALAQWVREVAESASAYHGLPDDLVRTLHDPGSALWESCSALHDAGRKLLERAQATGRTRPDVTGADLFALIGAASWIAGQQSPVAERRDQVLTVMIDGLRHPLA